MNVIITEKDGTRHEYKSVDVRIRLIFEDEEMKTFDERGTCRTLICIPSMWPELDEVKVLAEAVGM